MFCIQSVPDLCNLKSNYFELLPTANAPAPLHPQKSLRVFTLSVKIVFVVFTSIYRFRKEYIEGLYEFFTTSVKIAIKGSLKGVYALPFILRKLLDYANVKKFVKMRR